MKIFKTIHQVIIKFMGDGCSIYAAAMTYISLLALVPFSIVFFTILTFFSSFRAYVAQIQKFIFSNFIASSADVIQNYLQNFINQGSHLSLWSVAALLVTVVLVAVNVVDIFDRIWRVEAKPSFIYIAAKYALIIFLCPILVGALLFVSDYFYFIPYVENISFLFPPLLIFIVFTLIYNRIPNCHIHWLSSALSGFIAMLLFMAAKNGFSIYIAHSNYKALYGLFAVIPVFLVWIYLCWWIILLGAEINYVVERQYFKEI